MEVNHPALSAGELPLFVPVIEYFATSGTSGVDSKNTLGMQPGREDLNRKT